MMANNIHQQKPKTKHKIYQRAAAGEGTNKKKHTSLHTPERRRIKKKRYLFFLRDEFLSAARSCHGRTPGASRYARKKQHPEDHARRRRKDNGTKKLQKEHSRVLSKIKTNLEPLFFNDRGE